MLKKNNQTFCFICGRPRPVKAIFHKGRITIIQCLECGARFRPRQEHFISDPGNNDQEYYRHTIRYNEGNRLFFRLVLESLLKDFPDLRNGDFLDFGCGVGNAILEADRLGFKTCGIDSSRWAIEQCRRQGIKVYDTLDALRKERLKFDLINLNHVLEHISDPLSFLSVLSGFLKGEGILRIEVPNCAKLGFWSLFPETKHIAAKPSIDHIYYYDKIVLRRILAQAGYDIIDIHTEGFGAEIRHRGTMKNPDWRARLFSKVLRYTQAEKIFGLDNFLVALAKRKL